MASIKHRISRDQIVYSLDKAHSPVLEIDSGDVITFETYDARTGTIQKDEDLLDRPHPIGANPVTGPVVVRGAEPGDALCVDIQQIKLADEGFLGVKAGMGLLGSQTRNYATKMVKVRDDTVHFGDRIRFPTHPMIGVIGTAPAGKGISTMFPGPHGGNMDNKYVTTGSRVYLPVNVQHALFGLGDVHGAMGDGEITYIGLEICAEVTVKVELLKNTGLCRPLIETPECWVTTAEHNDMAQSARMAAEEMVRLLEKRLGLSFEEAYMLMSAAVDVQICQCCDPGAFPVTTRAVISKAILR